MSGPDDDDWFWQPPRPANKHRWRIPVLTDDDDENVYENVDENVYENVDENVYGGEEANEG